MTNKILFILICVTMLFSIPVWFLSEEEILPYGISLAISEWLAMYLMLINGTFIKRPYYKVLYFLIGCVLLGAIFKILHLTGADEITLSAQLAIPVVYSVHFFQKNQKELLDVMKYISVILRFVIPAFITANFIPDEYQMGATYTSLIIFWFTFIYFIMVSYHKIPGFRKV